jgi:hypothetical protein
MLGETGNCMSEKSNADHCLTKAPWQITALILMLVANTLVDTATLNRTLADLQDIRNVGESS